MAVDYSKMQLYDYLEHYKTENGQECIVFPITRASNVIGSPTIVTDMNDSLLSEMCVFSVKEVNVSDAEIVAQIGSTDILL